MIRPISIIAYAFIAMIKMKMIRYPMRSLENMVSFIFEAFTYSKSLIALAKPWLPVQEDFLLRAEELLCNHKPKRRRIQWLKCHPPDSVRQFRWREWDGGRVWFYLLNKRLRTYVEWIRRLFRVCVLWIIIKEGGREK